MLIAQITDLHLQPGAAGDENEARLRAVVARLADLAPDCVLLTGDVTEQGDAASYRRARDLLASLGVPVLATVGNHDRRAPFRAAFDTPDTDGFIQYATAVGDLRILVLDTLEEGREGGAFCARRAAWLEERLAEAPRAPTLIALHHPPARTGVAWMDANADGPWARRIARVVARHPRIVRIVAGHIHRALLLGVGGRALVTSGSVAFPVALDLRPLTGAPDGRALIEAGPPAFALHRWAGGVLATDFATAADPPVIARYDASTEAMVARMQDEPPI